MTINLNKPALPELVVNPNGNGGGSAPPMPTVVGPVPEPSPGVPRKPGINAVEVIGLILLLLCLCLGLAQRSLATTEEAAKAVEEVANKLDKEEPPPKACSKKCCGGSGGNSSKATKPLANDPAAAGGVPRAVARSTGVKPQAAQTPLPLSKFQKLLLEYRRMHDLRSEMQKKQGRPISWEEAYRARRKNNGAMDQDVGGKKKKRSSATGTGPGGGRKLVS